MAVEKDDKGVAKLHFCEVIVDEERQAHFRYLEDKADNGSATPVFLIVVPEDNPFSGNPAAVIKEVERGIGQIMISNNKLHLCTEYDEETGIARLSWRGVPLAVSDGYHLVTSDTAYLSKNMYKAGVGILGHARTFGDHADRIPALNGHSNANCPEEMPLVKIEDIARAVSSNVNSKEVQKRRLSS